MNRSRFLAGLLLGFFICLSGVVSYSKPLVTNEFPIPSALGSANLIVEGVNSDLWFTLSAGQIGRITTSGSLSYFQLSPGSNPSGLVVTPAGTVWFTDFALSQVGYLNSSGVPVTFNLPSGSAPQAIAFGSDGNIWFTEFGTGMIGTISTTTFAITQYPLTSGEVANGITSGSGGDLWFVEYQYAFIGPPTDTGQMNTSGTILNEFPMLGGDFVPVGSVIVGSDGDIWSSYTTDACLGPACHEIEKVTSSGTVTDVYSFDPNLNFTGPFGAFYLTNGADGAVWFTGGPTALGRLTTAGVYTGFSIPSSGTGGIAKGPDNDIWYTGTCAKGSGSCIERLGLLAVGSLAFVPTPVNESGSTSLSGTIADLTTSASHTVVVNWGDGSQNSTVTLTSQTGTFNFGPITHSYLNNQVGTSSSPFTATVTVTNDQGGSASGTVQETVDNVAPQLTNVPQTLPVTAGGLATLTGNVVDPGTEDTETLSITWGDNSTVQKVNLHPGSSSFTVTHQYVTAGTFQLIVTDTDDDGAVSTVVTTAIVPALPPPAITLSPTSVTFPPQLVGAASQQQSISVTNSGSGPLLVSNISATGPYTQTNDCAAPLSAGLSCSIEVVFTPPVLGTSSGALSIVDNAPGSPQTVSLTGTGVGPNLGFGVASGETGSATIPAGKAARFMLSIGGQGVSGTASLTCTGAPVAATCSVPATVSVSASSITPLTVGVTTTAGSSAKLYSPDSRGNWMWAIGIFGLVFLPQGKRGKLRIVSGIGLALMALFLLASCGGSSSSTPSQAGTPAGVYKLTVTAVIGSNTASVPLTLTVQ